MAERLSLAHARLIHADDDPAVLSATGLFLQEKGALIVGTATSLPDADALLSNKSQKLNFNTAIIDNRIKEENGADVAHLLMVYGFIVPIIAFTSDETDQPWAHVTIVKPKHRELAAQIIEIMGDAHWLEKHTPVQSSTQVSGPVLPSGRRAISKDPGFVRNFSQLPQHSIFHR